MKTGLLVAYAVLVGLISLRPGEGPGIEHADKVSHFVVYGFFAVLGFMAAKNTRMFYIICVAIIVYGGLLEVAQYYVISREMSLLDFIANTLGVLVGIAVVTLATNWSQKRA